MKHWFISDLHIKDLNERNGNTLLRFLFFLNQHPTENQLFLLGDIFDLWLSNGRVFQKHYKKLIDEIRKFIDAGGKIFYFEGNHDFHVDVFWTKKLGIPVYENEAFFKIGGYKVRLEHGDYINPDDKTYLKYRETVRQPWVESIAHAVPGAVWKWVGETVSARSRKKTGHYSQTKSEEIRAMIRAYALRVYNAEDFDLIITGHMHVFDDFTFQTKTGPVRSINLGTWLDKPQALLVENDKIEMIDVEKLLE